MPKRPATALVTPSAAPARAAKNQQTRSVRVGDDARRRDGPVHRGRNVAHGATTVPVLSLCHSEMATQPPHSQPSLHPTHLPPLSYPILPPFTSTHAPHHYKVPLAMPGEG